MAGKKKDTMGCGFTSYLVIAAILFVGWILYDYYIGRKQRVPYEYVDCWREMGLTNRYYYKMAVEEGKWPNPPSVVFSTFAGLPSVDPWGSPFKFIEKDGGLYVYSFGPDKTDDHASTEYFLDPKNPFTPGDVICWLRSLSDNPPVRPVFGVKRR